MLRAALSIVAVLLLTVTPVIAQADAAGEWMIEFSTPATGPVEFTMYVIQDGCDHTIRNRTPSTVPRSGNSPAEEV